MVNTPDPPANAANGANPPESPPHDRFTQIVAVALGLLFTFFGLVLISVYFIPPLRPGLDNPQQMAQFGVFFTGIGLSVFLAIIFREKYDVTTGNWTFAGTLAATAIFAWVAWPYLFPDKPQAPAQLGSIKFNIECDRPPLSGQKGNLVATLNVREQDEDLVMRDLQGILGKPPDESQYFVSRDGNSFDHLSYFRGRHILRAQNMGGNELEVPGSVSEFSVVNVLGPIGIDAETDSVLTNHLFDIELRPNSAVGRVDITVTVDLTNNDLHPDLQYAELACDFDRPN